jgi:fatty acid synthase
VYHPKEIQVTVSAGKISSYNLDFSGMGHEEVKDMLPEEIQVACHNAPDNCTLSGPAEHVTEFVAKLQKKNIFAKSVNVSERAYHSRYVHPAVNR